MAEKRIKIYGVRTIQSVDKNYCDLMYYQKREAGKQQTVVLDLAKLQINLG